MASSRSAGSWETRRERTWRPCARGGASLSLSEDDGRSTGAPRCLTHPHRMILGGGGRNFSQGTRPALH
eukprot:2079696-Pleurochrysis_carterae.AAC.1